MSKCVYEASVFDTAGARLRFHPHEYDTIRSLYKAGQLLDPELHRPEWRDRISHFQDERFSHTQWGRGAYRENEDSEIMKGEMCKRQVANKKLSYCLISLPSFVTEMRIACSEI
jgi:hypothetical protein